MMIPRLVHLKLLSLTFFLQYVLGQNIKTTSKTTQTLATTQPSNIVAEPTKIVFITGCNSCSTNSPTAITNSNLPNDKKLSSTEIGGIIGGCLGFLVLVGFIFLLVLVRRKRKLRQEEIFNIGAKSSNKKKKKEQEIKVYNANSDNVFARQAVIPPVVVYSDHQKDVEAYIAQHEEQPKDIKKSRKYSFISQALSNMRHSMVKNELSPKIVTASSPIDRQRYPSEINKFDEEDSTTSPVTEISINQSVSPTTLNTNIKLTNTQYPYI